MTKSIRKNNSFSKVFNIRYHIHGLVTKFFIEIQIIRKNHFVNLIQYFYITYLQPIITQYFIDNKSEIWLLFLIAHSKR